MRFSVCGAGYDQGQVDAYIFRVSEVYNNMRVSHAELENRCASLKAEYAKLEAAYQQKSQELMDSGLASSKVDAAIIGQVLIDAKKSAEELVSEAKREAEMIVSNAKSQANMANIKKAEAIQIIKGLGRSIQEIMKEMDSAEINSQNLILDNQVLLKDIKPESLDLSQPYPFSQGITDKIG